MLIRDIDDGVKHVLRKRAARLGHSLEEEAREILRAAAATEVLATADLGSRIAARFAADGWDDDIPEWRGLAARGVDFEE